MSSKDSEVFLKSQSFSCRRFGRA